jgi:hypothetical protein
MTTTTTPDAGLFYGNELIGTFAYLSRAKAWADANNRMYSRHGHPQLWCARRLTKTECSSE